MSRLKDIILINPFHISLKESGHGQFPDRYSLTEAGIKHISKGFNKDLSIIDIIKGEIELAEEPMEYSEKIILDSIRALIEQYEHKQQL